MPSKLFAPITIIHYPGPGGGHSIKHTYYCKAISGLVGRPGVEPGEALATRFTVATATSYGITTHMVNAAGLEPANSSVKGWWLYPNLPTRPNKNPRRSGKNVGDYRNILGTHYPWR